MMADPNNKSDAAFRTIGELADDLGLPQHILRYWETRFPQLRPLQRAGNRRYYRPGDVALAKRIDRLLNQEGYTVKGVQKLLSGKTATQPVEDRSAAAVAVTPTPPDQPMVDALISLRSRLRRALEVDDIAARI